MADLDNKKELRKEKQKEYRDKRRERIRQLEQLEGQFNLIKLERDDLQNKFKEAADLKQEFVNFLKFKGTMQQPQQPQQPQPIQQEQNPYKVIKNDFFKKL